MHIRMSPHKMGRHPSMGSQRYTHQYIHVLLSFIGKITDSLMTYFYLPWNCWLLYDWKQNSEPFTPRAEELNCLGVWKCLGFSLSNHQHSQNLIGWFFSLSSHSNVLLESNNDVSDQPSPSTTSFYDFIKSWKDEYCTAARSYYIWLPFAGRFNSATKGTVHYDNHKLLLDRHLCSYQTFPAGLKFSLCIMYGCMH